MRIYEMSEEVTKELAPLSNAERLDKIVDALTLPFNVGFGKDTRVEWLYNKATDRYYFMYDGCYVDIPARFVTDLRWDIILRAFEILETGITNKDCGV